MYKRNRHISFFFTCLLLATTCHLSYSQVTEEVFQIEPPGKRYPGSYYNSIKLLDLRENPDDFGKIQHGAQNKVISVVVNSPLATQLGNLLTAMIDTTAGNHELVLMIRQIQFSEVLGFPGKGFFEFSGVLFGGQPGHYKKLISIDSVAEINAVDATKKLLRTGSNFFNDLLSAHLRAVNFSDLGLTYEQLPAIDSFEKEKIPLYKVARFKDGLYYNFFTFAAQQPNRIDFDVKFNQQNEVRHLILTNPKGRKVPVYNDGKIYAFVFNGQPYISGLTKTFYPLFKKDGDFYFRGRAEDVKAGDVAAAWLLFGAIGGAIASSNTSLFEIKIDHITGEFKKIRKIKP